MQALRFLASFDTSATPQNERTMTIPSVYLLWENPLFQILGIFIAFRMASGTPDTWWNDGGEERDGQKKKPSTCPGEMNQLEIPSLPPDNGSPSGSLSSANIYSLIHYARGLSVLARTHLPIAMQETQETQVQSLGQEGPQEKEMATDSSILAWEVPWTEEPGRLQSIGSQRVQQD